MKLVDFLSEPLIIAELGSSTRESALEEIAGHISRVKNEIDPAAAFRCLMERERMGSTGIGNGFAIPHAKLPHIRQIVGCVARSKSGVAFESLDGRPVYLILTLLAPEGGMGLHLKALARASKVFKDASFRARMMEGEDHAAMWGTLIAEDRRIANNE